MFGSLGIVLPIDPPSFVSHLLSQFERAGGRSLGNFHWFLENGAPF